MDDFTRQLQAHTLALERYVRFRLDGAEDAQDVIQEICLTACEKYAQLRDPEAFKSWLLRIARNKCADYYRRKATRQEVPLEELPELPEGCQGAADGFLVRQTLLELNEKDRQILYLYFWQELSQERIANLLHIPLGTVKSRLYTAKQNFRRSYPYTSRHLKGETGMKKLPELLPDYHIVANAEPPFPVKWEELTGWFLIPKLGQKLNWGIYDNPSRRCTSKFCMQVTGKASVHGIEGVELTAREVDCRNQRNVTDRTFVAQLTDSHSRILATAFRNGDVRRYITFLDGEDFLPNWGFGENNCGNETNIAPKGDIVREGHTVSSAPGKSFLLDIVGRYAVTIGGKRYDTICVMDIETYEEGMVAEQYLDKNGRTILWRRFNREGWAGESWVARLPANERITVNGQTYVHWYDCITDYILE